MKVKETNRLLNFADFRQMGSTFIETGTCYGRSVSAALAAGYERVKSVEAKKEFYEHCKKMFSTKPNVELFLGKSIDHLQAMLEPLQGPAVIWLDAHVSGEMSAGYADYMEKGELSDFHQHTALKKELAIVLKHSNQHVILIDDQNGPNVDNAVYLDTMYEANPDYRFYWIDEQAGDTFYKNKVLAAIDRQYTYPPKG
jgi:hypothetical protein